MAPTFCKMLLAPSSPRLALPPDFVTNLLECEIQEGPIILLSGRHSWRLEIEQIDDDYYFTNGWNNVVHDMQLRFGDFLYFRPSIDQSTFQMSIFSPKECDRFLAPKVKNEKMNEDEDDDPRFKLILTKTHARMLRFPAEFARLAGIDAEGTMTVRNVDGKEWVMGLRLDKSFRSARYFLSSGWSSFQRENDLMEGDECVFRFIRAEGKLLLEKVCTKKEWLATYSGEGL